MCKSLETTKEMNLEKGTSGFASKCLLQQKYLKGQTTTYKYTNNKMNIFHKVQY